MTGMNDGDSEDDFNILDFAMGPDGDGARGMNILDVIEDKDTKKGGKDETKTLPHMSGKQQTDDPLGSQGNHQAHAGIKIIFC